MYIASAQIILSEICISYFFAVHTSQQKREWCSSGKFGKNLWSENRVVTKVPILYFVLVDSRSTPKLYYNLYIGTFLAYFLIECFCLEIFFQMNRHINTWLRKELIALKMWASMQEMCTLDCTYTLQLNTHTTTYLKSQRGIFPIPST